MNKPALHIDKLSVVLPSGVTLLDNVSMTLEVGEVAVLLGGSGAGKSTFSRVLFELDELRRQGFTVTSSAIDYDRNTLGLVPQYGGLFDHLDVHGNINLAKRYRQVSKDGGPISEGADSNEWLRRVGLDGDLGSRPAAKLSGGQAQRVAVARALASERRLLLLDEPSVGLDPHRVRMLAQLIRQQVNELGLAAIVVTHDPALAAGVADKLYLLDPDSRKLRHLFADTWPGPMERPDVDEKTRGSWLLAVETEVVTAIANRTPEEPSEAGRPLSRWRPILADRLQNFAAPFAVVAEVLPAIPKQFIQKPKDFLSILAKVLIQTTLRPIVFYTIVSTLIGFTLLFVLSKVGGAGVRTDALLRQIGGSYAVALAPPLAAILFIAASGSATNAWFGSMELTRQTAALEALGISKKHYLWGPAWVGLGVAFLLIASCVTFGMLLGGWLLCQQQGISGAWELLWADILDPRPERAQYVGRALFLLWLYAWGMASNIVAKGSAPKSSSDDVTRGMTTSVVSSTLWVVSLELATVLWMFA